MWRFCKSGFFSAVRHQTQLDHVHVRARFQGDLDRLIKRHNVTGVTISHTPGNDYAYRADITIATWAQIVKTEAADIDYVNFKNAVHDGTARDSAYMGAWSAMRSGQERAR